MTSSNRIKVVIIGGGATGVVVALNLLQSGRSDIFIQIVESEGSVGAGRAYRKQPKLNILNVPAQRMSAFKSNPQDFLNWLSLRGIDESSFSTWPFVSRELYGNYLQDRLSIYELNRWEHIQDKAIKVRYLNDDCEVYLGSGKVLRADYLVIATGYKNELKATFLNPDPSETPWSVPEFEKMNIDELSGSLLVIGTGLSAVDIWRQARSNKKIQLTLISRRGLLPMASVSPTAIPVHIDQIERLSPSQLLLQIRELNLRGCNWVSIVDYLRPKIPGIWKSWEPRQKKQFINHIKPFWEVVRHRIPEMVSNELQEDLRSNSLKVFSGRPLEVKRVSSRWQISYVDRRTGKNIKDDFDWIVIATGSQVDQQLLNEGDLPGVSRCKFGFGYTFKENSSPNVWLAGPASKSNLWEITAIPEISEQAANIAKELTELI